MSSRHSAFGLHEAPPKEPTTKPRGLRETPHGSTRRAHVSSASWDRSHHGKLRTTPTSPPRGASPDAHACIGSESSRFLSSSRWRARAALTTGPHRPKFPPAPDASADALPEPPRPDASDGGSKDANDSSDSGDGGAIGVTLGEATVGPQGGDVQLGDVTLTIPPGALAQGVTLRAIRIDATPPTGTAPPHYVFEPSGLHFDAPITVRLPLNRTGPRSVRALVERGEQQSRAARHRASRARARSWRRRTSQRASVIEAAAAERRLVRERDDQSVRDRALLRSLLLGQRLSSGRAGSASTGSDPDLYELCDDGNTITESCAYGQASCVVCRSDCTRGYGAPGGRCGDGLVNGPEACDDGNTVTEPCAYGEASCTVCRADCTFGPGAVVGQCGDGTVNGPEACDDGNTVTETCAYGEASCTVCRADCTLGPGTIGERCGDGTVNGPEACDDGNTVTEPCAYGEASCTVCRADCTLGPGVVVGQCGDGTVNGPEACDDGNTVTETCNYGLVTCTVCHAELHARPRRRAALRRRHRQRVGAVRRRQHRHRELPTRHVVHGVPCELHPRPRLGRVLRERRHRGRRAVRHVSGRRLLELWLLARGRHVLGDLPQRYEPVRPVLADRARTERDSAARVLRRLVLQRPRGGVVRQRPGLGQHHRRSARNPVRTSTTTSAASARMFGVANYLEPGDPERRRGLVLARRPRVNRGVRDDGNQPRQTRRERDGFGLPALGRGHAPLRAGGFEDRRSAERRLQGAHALAQRPLPRPRRQRERLRRAERRAVLPPQSNTRNVRGARRGHRRLAPNDVVSGTGKVLISADARYAVFVSAASNLVPDDTNGKPDVFLPGPDARHDDASLG